MWERQAVKLSGVSAETEQRGTAATLQRCSGVTEASCSNAPQMKGEGELRRCAREREGERTTDLCRGGELGGVGPKVTTFRGVQNISWHPCTIPPPREHL